jgi:hypothetical protein
VGRDWSWLAAKLCRIFAARQAPRPQCYNVLSSSGVIANRDRQKLAQIGDDKSIRVVPANAGTHTPRLLDSDAVLETLIHHYGRWLWVPAQGRDDERRSTVTAILPSTPLPVFIACSPSLISLTVLSMVLLTCGTTRPCVAHSMARLKAS